MLIRHMAACVMAWVLPCCSPVLVGAASYYLLPLPLLLLLLLLPLPLSCGHLLQEFDSIQEGELSTISRLAAEREDNMMWKEFRERLLRNIGLVSALLQQAGSICELKGLECKFQPNNVRWVVQQHPVVQCQGPAAVTVEHGPGLQRRICLLYQALIGVDQGRPAPTDMPAPRHRATWR